MYAGEAVTTQGRALEQEDPAEGMVGRKDWLAVFDTHSKVVPVTEG